MNDMEFRTFRAIAKPGKKIPGFSDEEIVFILGYYIFSIVFMMITLGMIPNILGIKINSSFSNTFMFVFFVLVPFVTLVILKTVQVGKQDGYVFQKTYQWFQSGLPLNLDLRNYEDRKIVKEWNNRKLGFLKNKEIYKKSKNPELKNYDLSWNPEEEKRKIEASYHKTLTMFENYLRNKENEQKRVYEEFYKDLEERIDYWRKFEKKF